MTTLRRLLLISFIESFATILVERAVYFFCKYELAFSDRENLWVALAFGAVYVVGAMASHAVARRAGERRLLLWMLAAQAAVHALMTVRPSAGLIFAGAVMLGGLNGLKWPVIESYVSAGRPPADTARAIGRFNISWSFAVPLSLAAAGPIIDLWPNGIFLLAGLLNCASIILSAPLTPRPIHLAQDHPERPGLDELARCRRLLVSSRWTMLGSYSLMWVLAALMPEIFRTLGYAVSPATAMSSILDVCRACTFALLTVWAGWHGRAWPIALSMATLPAGFFLVLFGPGLGAVLAGEVLFGLAAGITYFAALYYAMVVKNASVQAGGGHEGLIGTGFALGPAAALAGAMIQPGMAGVAYGVLPILVVTLAGGVWPLVGKRNTSN